MNLKQIQAYRVHKKYATLNVHEYSLCFKEEKTFLKNCNNKLRGVSTKLNKYILFTMQTFKKLDDWQTLAIGI
mgnify:CR=1 FL=1